MINTIFLAINITLIYAAPLLFAALGGLISERSGVTNIGLEGMMTLGAFMGACVGYYSQNPWLGFLAAGLAGGLMALFHAFASITLMGDQTISGTAMNFIGLGLALFLCRLAFDGATMSQPVPNKLPKILGSVARGSDNIILMSLNVDITVVISLVFALIIWFVLYKTKWGLRVRSVGEHPAAADTLGINVYKTRYICVILSGVMAGFGGAAKSLAVISIFSPLVISGQGFIALAAVIFGKWTPQGCVGACMLFGFANALVVLLGGEGAVVPSQLLAMLPYVLTLLVLVVVVGVGGKSGGPKASGVPYRKGMR